MNDWFNVGKIGDFIEGRGKAVDAGSERVAVFRVSGRLHAMQDHCPHMRASLADGRVVDGQRVTCHMHGWTFDLISGKPQGGRANCARIYSVESRGDDVWVRIPPPPAPAADDEEWIPWSDGFLREKEEGSS